MDCDLNKGIWKIKNVNTMGAVGDVVTFSDYNQEILQVNSGGRAIDDLECNWGGLTCNNGNVETRIFENGKTMMTRNHALQCINGQLVDIVDNKVIYSQK